MTTVILGSTHVSGPWTDAVQQRIAAAVAAKRLYVVGSHCVAFAREPLTKLCLEIFGVNLPRLRQLNKLRGLPAEPAELAQMSQIFGHEAGYDALDEL